MIDIQAKLQEIGPFIPGADDDFLVCRCEEVTRGEIRRAVHEGIFTIEEMRRYLRNGMAYVRDRHAESSSKQLWQRSCTKHRIM